MPRRGSDNSPAHSAPGRAVDQNASRGTLNSRKLSSLMGFTPRGQAFNQTRQRFLATHLAVAQTHWSRLRGLLGASADDFRNGCGLWIRPCRGVHTLAMRYPIDVVYLDRANTVVHVESPISNPGASPPSACKPRQCWNCQATPSPKQKPHLAIELKSKCRRTSESNRSKN